MGSLSEMGNTEMGGLGVRCQHPNQHQLLAPNRRQRKNHTSKLHELALLLPVALKTGTKKLTKVWGCRERRQMWEAELKISVTFPCPGAPTQTLAVTTPRWARSCLAWAFL